MESASAPPVNPYAQLQGQVHSAIDELNSDTSIYTPTRPAEELFRLENAVQIFFVTADGHVSTFSEPVTLRIFKFTDGGEQQAASAAATESTTMAEVMDVASAFIQVGGWTQPLIAGVSPCLLAANGAIMFPDIYSDMPNSSVGLVIMDKEEGEGSYGATSEERTQLIHLLQSLTAFKGESMPAKEDYNLGVLGKAIVSGAELVSKGIVVGTDKAGQLIEYVTEKSQERIGRAEEGQAQAKLGPVTKTTVRAAKATTNATVKVSGFVANRVGKLTKSLADYLADKAVGGSGDNSKPRTGAMAYLVDAARGGLIAYGTIYQNLETSAKLLGKNMKDNSVKIVEQKYGDEAAIAFGDAMTAAGNGALTYLNVQSLGAKGLLKKTAKETGKSVVKGVITNSESTQQPAITQQPM